MSNIRGPLHVFIRDLRVQDVTAVSLIEERSGGCGCPRKLKNALLVPNTFGVVAEEHDRLLAGWALYRFGGGEVELLRVAVWPSRRRRHVGTELIAKVAARAFLTDSTAVFLGVPETHLGTCLFFRALGFQSQLFRAGVAGEDLVRFEWSREDVARQAARMILQ